jgi:hypothetical protein
MRQIAGVFSQLEKTRLVKKLRAARERKRREAGRCEGRKTRLQRLEKLAKDAATDEARTPYQDAAKDLQAAVGMANRLRRANPVTGMRRSLRRIAEELAAAGHLNELGHPYNAMSISRML